MEGRVVCTKIWSHSLTMGSDSEWLLSEVAGGGAIRGDIGLRIELGIYSRICSPWNPSDRRSL